MGAEGSAHLSGKSEKNPQHSPMPPSGPRSAQNQQQGHQEALAGVSPASLKRRGAALPM